MSFVLIESVNVATPEPLGDVHGRKIFSSINKRPVTANQLYLTHFGLAGDQPTDTSLKEGKRVHGGDLKAVYAFPLPHLEAWSGLLDQSLSPGAFGENLTVTGVSEATVFPGDQWLWGDAVLEVTGARRPCFKLNMHRGPGTAKRMQENGMCGWYLRVVQPGLVPVGQREIVEIRPIGNRTFSIADLFREKIDRDPSIPGP